MPKNFVKKLVFVWTALMLLNNIYNAIQGDSSIDNYWIIFVFIAVEALICWTAYQMLKSKTWALVTLVIYFGLRTINIYTDEFSLYLKSGYDVEILIAKTIGINLVSLLTFILLSRELNMKRTAPIDNQLAGPQAGGPIS